ncbi:hypothetical protein BKN38_03395 [Helicobacter sp. CLO-3]|uniref:efflux RND transporter periplasmic adaptor subunit n=1 Tax=unclassified Helicobacter TaxID=2593540 RepID=UPI000805DCBF|nr:MULTISPECIES: efflux RND transporter periplasmic adaptor subunit [unclassified Helicobacter]OBV28492.1 hypothetical protein BA723_01950 [Helicobacter sp. CLO-3]OHU84195.1 hypothetical protein BKN38_03395 [Helicobacter sp. CLO-3]
MSASFKITGGKIYAKTASAQAPRIHIAPKIVTLCYMLFACALLGAKPVPVEITPIKYGNLNKIESFVGSVRFKEISSIAAPAQGIVQKVFFNIGDSVRKNQKLLSLDSALLLEDIKIKQAKIADARYTLERQKNELERYKNLLQSQSISIQQYENLEYEIKSQEARIQALEGELAISKAQVAQKTIYAPFDGIIVEQRVHIGEWVEVGNAICQILNSRDTEVVVDVSSSVVRALKLKQKVPLIIAGKKYQGSISALIPKADTLSRTFPVHIAVRNDGSFLDGMVAQALLDISANQKGFIIPRDSIVYRQNRAFVFIVRDKKAVRVPIEVVATQDSLALVLGELKSGEPIVSRGQDSLADEMEVKITNQSAMVIDAESKVDSGVESENADLAKVEVAKVDSAKAEVAKLDSGIIADLARLESRAFLESARLDSATSKAFAKSLESASLESASLKSAFLDSSATKAHILVSMR